MRNEKYHNGCELLSLDDLDYNKIASESLKKDLVDWCKADRKKWLDKPLNYVYSNLYLPIRSERFSSLPNEEKNNYIEKKKAFGIGMDSIKTNAMLRYAIERIKFYGTKENFIEAHGEYAFNRFFAKEPGSKLDTRWETIEELIKNGFD
jgi:hypothetical protein